MNETIWRPLIYHGEEYEQFEVSNDGQFKNVITGTNDSYYAQNKGHTKEGRLKRLIIISAVVIFVLTIAFFVIEHFFAG